jgi:glycosyltransferase involved in cell wall biosynthesis
MVRATPVACSDIPPLREVAGDAALYFDPLNTGSIAGALEQCLADEQLRSRLRAQGHERAKLFSWDRAAEETFACYERALRPA